MNKTVSVLLWVLTLTVSYAFIQEFSIYTEPLYQGDGLTLKTNHPDLSNFAPLTFGSEKSMCLRGFWGTYDGINYTGTRNTRGPTWNTRLCFNSRWESRTIKSIRHLGPSDSTVPSISLYEAANMVGRELIVDGPAITNLLFRPASFFTTAHSNWTLFSGDNFSGNASCFISTAEYHELPTLNSSFVIGSVLRGCIGRRIDTYIYAEDFNKDNIQY